MKEARLTRRTPDGRYKQAKDAPMKEIVKKLGIMEDLMEQGRLQNLNLRHKLEELDVLEDFATEEKGSNDIF